jgi:hypothetical protein
MSDYFRSVADPWGTLAAAGAETNEAASVDNTDATYGPGNPSYDWWAAQQANYDDVQNLNAQAAADRAKWSALNSSKLIPVLVFLGLVWGLLRGFRR